MPTKTQTPGDMLDSALARYCNGFDPALIELTEQAVFPHLIPVQPATGRKSRCTGILLGRPTPIFYRRGRSIFYRLSDVIAWLEGGEGYSSTADAATRRAAQ